MHGGLDVAAPDRAGAAAGALVDQQVRVGGRGPARVPRLQPCPQVIGGESVQRPGATADELGRVGPRMGRKIRHPMASGDTTCPRLSISHRAVPQVKAENPALTISAPSGDPCKPSSVRVGVGRLMIAGSLVVGAACRPSVL